MPPHLHPRSTATSTLFAGTLLASFIVVGIPHVFPCPRPRSQYLDSDRQLQVDSKAKSHTALNADAIKSSRKTMEDEAALLRMLQEEARQLEKEARECPVPKPSGWFGKVLGFYHEGRHHPDGKQKMDKS